MAEVTDRLSKRSQNDFSGDNYDVYTKKRGSQKVTRDELIKKIKFKNDLEKEKVQGEKIGANSRNVVIFTGRALVEILRDQTMEKSFMTLAYMCDLMVGSEISPLQK